MHKRAGIQAKTRGWQVARAFALLALTACSQGPTTDDEDGGERSDQVQLDFVDLTGSTPNKGVTLVRGALSDTQQARSTGAIRFFWTDQVSGSDHVTDNRKNSGNCGATFISKTYAITAAHCVPKDQLPADTASPGTNGYGNGAPFPIYQFRTTNLQPITVVDQATVEGAWPSYTQPYRINSNPTFERDAYMCVVKRRCSRNALNFAEQAEKFGQDSCPFTTDVDIALIHCPGRTSTQFGRTTPQNWTPVATSDSAAGDVDVWWFHEVLNLATTEDPYIPYQPDHNYLHYLIYRPMGSSYNETTWPNTNNYHYWPGAGAPSHTLIPLVSRTDASGVNYRRVGHASGAYTNTNTPICHGTSGSGVFTRTTPPTFLGPTVHGPGISNKLCHNINSTSNLARMDYARQVYTLQLEALAQVQGDR